MAFDRAILFRLATSEEVESVVRATPWGERAAWQAASRYVAGTTAAAALSVAGDLASRGMGTSLDLFGELVAEVPAAMAVADAYLSLADQVDE